MNHKVFYLLIMSSIFCSNICYSQKEPIKYTIDNVGYIFVSPELELQSGDYKEYTESYPQVGKGWVIFQQKGLNEYSPSAMGHFVRIMVYTIMGNKGDFLKVNADMDVSVSDLDNLNSTLKRQCIQENESMGIEVLLWYGVSVERINNQNCVKYSCLTKYGTNPPVEAAYYMFQNDDRVHLVSISCRKKDKDIWWPILMKSLNSFKITNIR